MPEIKQAYVERQTSGRHRPVDHYGGVIEAFFRDEGNVA